MSIITGSGSKNDDIVYSVLTRSRGKTRKQLCEELNLSRSTVLDAIVRLELAGLTERYPSRIKSPLAGRPKTYFRKVK